MHEPTKFWMVYGDGQRPPIVKHDSPESAEREAARLAAQVPGVSFYVLVAYKGYVAQRPVQEFTLADPVPF